MNPKPDNGATGSDRNPLSIERDNSGHAHPRATTVFLSFNMVNDQPFVAGVYHYLHRQPGLKVYFYDRNRDGDAFPKVIDEALTDVTHFIFFHGQNIGDYQIHEANSWLQKCGHFSDSHRVIVELPNPEPWPGLLAKFHNGVDPLRLVHTPGEPCLKERHAALCAADLARTINGKWIPYDGLPEHYIFDYEKDVIEQFASPTGRPEDKYLKMGCPEKWPELRQRGREEEFHKNPLDPEAIGGFREETVLVDVRSRYHHPSTARSSECPDPCCLIEKDLTFLEAGPRKMLLHGPENPLNIGVLVSGGIAPGINAVIAGLVDRHLLYWREHFKGCPADAVPSLIVHGYRDGFSGLLNKRQYRMEFMQAGDDDPQLNEGLAFVMQNANSGGSMFGTSRCEQLSDGRNLEERNRALDRVLDRLWNDQIDILYIIGGDGSMKAAHALHVLNEEHCRNHQLNARPFTVVGIPKTMDNDILWVWQSFGFMSAVEKASECLRLLHTEAVSNPRFCVIQLFGSDSGFTVSHAALASLQCDAALIPEMPFDMEGLFQHVRSRLLPRFRPAREQESPFGMIVMAETAVPEDWYLYVRWDDHLRRTGQSKEELLSRINEPRLQPAIERCIDTPNSNGFTCDLSRDEVEAIILFVANGRRVYGQTPDPLRTVSLRLVSQILQNRIQVEMGRANPYWKTFRVFANEPRYLLRSSPPSANDIISGRRFGILAVDNAMAGYTDFMISQWLTEFVLVPLPLVVLGRKRVPKRGIFWKSVVAKTAQPTMRTTSPASAS